MVPTKHNIFPTLFNTSCVTAPPTFVFPRDVCDSCRNQTWLFSPLHLSLFGFVIAIIAFFSCSILFEENKSSLSESQIIDYALMLGFKFRFDAHPYDFTDYHYFCIISKNSSLNTNHLGIIARFLLNALYRIQIIAEFALLYSNSILGFNELGVLLRLYTSHGFELSLHATPCSWLWYLG